MYKSIVCFLGVIVITFISSNSIAGRVEGPGKIEDVISPGRFNNHSINLRGGDFAKIDVKGDGSSDLDCFLMDDMDKIVDSDVNDTDRCDLKVTPDRTSKYELRIYNAGSKVNSYIAKSN